MRLALILMIGLLVSLCGCGEIDEKNNNANSSANSEPSGVTIEAGKYVDGAYQEMAAGDPMEIISGFQGGWHVEPVLHVKGAQMSQLTGTVSFSVRDSSGETLASSGEQELDPGFFNEDETGWSYFSFPVIFDVEPFEYEGEEVFVIGNGTVAGEPIEIEQSVTLTNEVDELEGFGGGRG